MSPLTEDERKGMLMLVGILTTVFAVGYLLGSLL